MDTHQRLQGLLGALEPGDHVAFLRQAQERAMAMHNGSPVDRAAILQARTGTKTFRLAHKMLDINCDYRGGYDWDNLLGVPSDWYPMAICHLRYLGATGTKYWDTFLSKDGQEVLNPPFLNGPRPIINCATDQAVNR